MSKPLHLELPPATQKLLEALPGLPARVRAGVLAAVARQDQLTVGVIQQRYLSHRGQDTLGVITNRLRGGVRAAKAEIIGGGLIRSRIGNNVKYAGAHEFGVDKEVNVKAHVRRILAPPKTPVASISIDPATGYLKRGAARKPKRKTLGQMQVKAHHRHMKMPARSPIRRGLQDCLPAYAAEIARAMEAAITATN